LKLQRERCENKFIPQMYKTASRKDRLALVAGLIDTDGSLANGCYDYISKSSHLADDLAFVCRSLGFAAYVTPCLKQAQTGPRRLYYRVCVSGDFREVPCRVGRKQAEARQQKKSVLRTGFKIVNTNTAEDFFGFTLSGDGRYLLDDFTVTHNSGKSFGYGVPAIQSKKRIIISTAKKQLQHQLALKDLPFLGERLEQAITVALLKGKANYACQVKGFTLPPDDAKVFSAWVEKSPTGDLTDWPGRKPAYWQDVTAEDCVGGKRCRFSKQCGYWRAKDQIKTAQIVVANHHVVAWDLRFGPKKLLGNYDVLIVDEAHQAVGAFRGAYTKTLTPFSMKRVIKMGDRAGFNVGTYKQLEDAWAAMFKEVANKDGEIAANPFGIPGEEAGHILSDMLIEVKKELAAKGATMYDNEDDPDYRPSSQRDAAWAKLDASERDYVANLEMLAKAIDRPKEALTAIAKPDLNTVLYINTTEKGHKIVNAAPINIGSLVGPKLQQIDTVILTSATIAVNGNFSDIKSQLGLTMPVKEFDDEGNDTGNLLKKRKIEELVLETPFDYASQAVLYTPQHMPHAVSGSSKFESPERTKYIEAVALECKKLIKASDGNAFILFTATQDMKDVHMALMAEELDNPLIVQAEDAESTLKEFMRTPRSVILGLKSFWEGVDVVGDKLRLVIITKLPFPMVSDPVIKARSRAIVAEGVAAGQSEQTAERGVFQAVQIPVMLTDLRQGAGRLIRSKTDKGVLAILDPRIWTGNGKQLPIIGQKNYQGYGGLAASAIGFGNRTADFNFVTKFLAKLRQEEAARAAKQGDSASAGA
jgi:ATP-dependent DNA helicase DinG